MLTCTLDGCISPALLENVQVAAYGGERTALSHLAMVTARGPRTLGVTVYDREVRIDCSARFVKLFEASCQCVHNMPA
jgi:ribosome recycling factor